VLAGTSEQGLWTSTDCGITWRRDASLCALGFRRLECENGQRLTALAPTGGAWTSTDDGKTWRRTLEASLYEPVLAHVTMGEAWLAARAEGLWHGQPGTEPALVLEVGEAPIVALAGAPAVGAARSMPRVVWAGAADGSLWTSQNGGAAWKPLDVPFRGRRLLGLAFSPHDGTPLVGVFSDQRKEVSLWRYDEERWQCWLSRADSWPGLALSPSGVLAETSWAALGGRAYYHTQGGWEEVEIADHEGGVAAITGTSPGGVRYLVSGGEVLCRDAGGAWQSLPLPSDAAAPIDLCLLPSAVLLCLDAAGIVWRHSAESANPNIYSR
jgi:hypothetical protein